MGAEGWKQIGAGHTWRRGGMPVRVLVVAGARPNFMKVAPILRALSSAGHTGVLVHTGQHYDAQMSDAFFRDLQIPEPDFHLEVGSGTHAHQTAKVMLAFEPVLESCQPDWVVVVGDVNSTMACGLVTAKLRPKLGSRLAHVEAGLRSGDWSMPEEINRLVTDRISDLLLLPSHDALDNLTREGIPRERIVFVGNVMIDTLRQQLPDALAANVPGKMGLEPGRYVVCTLHRPSNVDDPATLTPVLQGMALVAARMPVVLPLHPRTRRNAEQFGIAHLLDGLLVTEPLGYRDMLSLTAQSAVALTDSGGLQEETTSLGVPCVTLREQTERPVTITEGTNRLAPWPLSPEGIFQTFEQAMSGGRGSDGRAPIPGWDGKAAERVVAALEGALDGR